MARRQHLTLLTIFLISVFLVIKYFAFSGPSEGTSYQGHLLSDQKPVNVDDGILKGAATAPKLGNDTLKAELGNAAWKLLHTMMAKFPDNPTEDDSTALKSYIHLFARLYPCGECARHFQQILKKFPPQVATRSTAAVWACHVHNVVNESLKKDIFDCSKIGDFYDCGCAEDAPVGAKQSKRFTPLELDKEGLTPGG